jgi:hypothetical protein
MLVSILLAFNNRLINNLGCEKSFTHSATFVNIGFVIHTSGLSI